MSCRSDFAAFLCPQGLACGTLNPTQPSGNSILATAHYVYCLKVNGELLDSDRSDLYTKLTNECEILPGFFRRAKAWASNQEARDDYIALAYLSKTLDWPVAKEILAFGRAHRFAYGPLKLAGYFPNPQYDPLSSSCIRSGPLSFKSGTTPEAWLWRDRGLLASLQHSAGEKPSFLNRVIYGGGTEIAGSSTDKDGWMLGYLELETARGTCDWNRKVYETFFGRLTSTWSTMNAVFAAYLGNSDNPFVKWWKPAAF